MGNNLLIECQYLAHNTMPFLHSLWVTMNVMGIHSFLEEYFVFCLLGDSSNLRYDSELFSTGCQPTSGVLAKTLEWITC